MATTTNAENVRQYKNRFSLNVEQITCLKKLRIYLQIANELHNDVLRYRKFSFGQVDPFYCKILTSSAKSNVQMTCAHLIELTFIYN